MDTKHSERLTARAATAIEAATAAREALRNALTYPGARIDSLMDTTLTAEGAAKPWMRLLQRIDRHGVREGLAKQRAECTELLVQFGPTMSTSLVINAASIAEHEGLRRFLAHTDFATDEDQAPTPTPAQRRALHSIADHTLRLKSDAKGLWIHGASYDTPRVDTLLRVIGQGWAHRDETTSLEVGQAVTLTEAGGALIPR